MQHSYEGYKCGKADVKPLRTSGVQHLKFPFHWLFKILHGVDFYFPAGSWDDIHHELHKLKGHPAGYVKVAKTEFVGQKKWI